MWFLAAVFFNCSKFYYFLLDKCVIDLDDILYPLNFWMIYEKKFMLREMRDCGQCIVGLSLGGVHCPPNSSLIYWADVFGQVPGVDWNVEAVRDILLEKVEILPHPSFEYKLNYFCRRCINYRIFLDRIISRFISTAKNWEQIYGKFIP